MDHLSSTFCFEAIGAQWVIHTRGALSPEGQRATLARVREFDAVYSRFRPDSLVGQMAEAGGHFVLPVEAARLFDLYDQLHRLTDGAVDPLVGSDLERLGYDRTYSLRPTSEKVPAERLSWASSVEREGATLITQRPLKLDFGAAGKGLLVDLISGFLTDAGHAEHLVDGGGDLRHTGEHGVMVDLEHPDDPQLVIGVVHLQNGALCASAVNRRAWGEGLHHVLDARTGRPTREVVATWGLAEDAATADGLATALFFTPPEVLSSSFEFSSVQLNVDGLTATTLNFTGELFTTEETT